jgi:hypothetical protein
MQQHYQAINQNRTTFVQHTEANPEMRAEQPAAIHPHQRKSPSPLNPLSAAQPAFMHSHFNDVNPAQLM